MKEHDIIITPANCGFGTGLNVIGTFYEDEYNARTDRAVLFYEPFDSKFKLKSVTSRPYLEPAFFGIKKGDILEVEFDAFKLQDKTTTLDVEIGQINADDTTTSKIKDINVVNLERENKHYKINTIINSSFDDDMIGIYFNITNKTTVSEICISNIHIKIKTNNNYFKINEELILLDTQERLLESLNLTSTYKHNEFVDYKTQYDAGRFTIDSDGILTSVSGSAVARGTVVYLGYNTRKTGAVMYLEYKVDADYTLRALMSSFDSTGTKTKGADQWLPTSTAWKKKMLYVARANNKPGYNYFEILGKPTTNTFSIKNMILINTDFSDNKRSMLGKY